MEAKYHPVWDLYDFYRTARLNVKYYSFMLHKFVDLNFWIEFILAVTTSTVVISFTVWNTDLGKIIWTTFSMISAVLAISKPLLNITDKIRELEEFLTSYRTLEHDLKILVKEISQKKMYNNEMSERYLSAYERLKENLTKTIPVKENRKLIKKFENEVNLELPPSQFFVPEN